MVSLENLMLYVPMALLFVMLPGPDFALIAKISLLEGRPQGQAAACGVALGICVHTAAAMLGISAIIVHSVFLFNVLKYVGAAYLVWLGIKALRYADATGVAVTRTAVAVPGVQKRQISRLSFPQWRRCFVQGFLTNVLNPKAVILFLTFLPQFTNPMLPLGSQFLLLGGIMASLCFIWYMLLAYMLGRVHCMFESYRFQIWLQRCAGAIFIVFGLKLVTTHAH